MGQGWSPAFAAAYFIEPWKFKFLLLLIPLYSRIKSEEVENSVARGEILGYLRQNPGAHYKLIKKDLGYGNNKLTYHLDVLQKSNRIKWRNDGRLKRYYPKKYSIPEETGIKNEILRIIDRLPGVNQKQIARSLDIDPRTAGKYLRQLRDDNKVVEEKETRELRYFSPTRQPVTSSIPHSDD